MVRSGRTRSVFPMGLVGILALAWTGGPAAAKQPAATPPPVPKPAAPAATAPASGADQQARALLTAAMAKLRGAKSYADQVETRIELKASAKGGADLSEEEVYRTTLRFAPPNRIALRTEDYAILCDGKKLWLHAEALRQYKVAPAPQRIDLAALREDLGVDEPPHPVLYLIQTPGTFAELFPMVKGFSAVEKQERDGRGGWLLKGTFDASTTPLGFEGQMIPFTVWLDEKTGLPGELRFDLTEAFRQATRMHSAEDAETADGPPVPEKVDLYQATLRLSEVKLDSDIPAQEYVYEPSDVVTEVHQFNWEALAPQPTTKDLIGQPAPPLSGLAFDGKPMALEEMRGRVVVLDFWATWCVPCIQGMPGMQKIADHFAKQPVTMIGIAGDPKSAEKKARKIVDDKKVTFRQLLDFEMKTGKAYKVQQVPCAVVIDGKGIVQAVHIGLTPTLHEEIEKEIAQLLKGESLVQPGQPAKGKEEPAKGNPLGRRPVAKPPKE